MVKRLSEFMEPVGRGTTGIISLRGAAVMRFSILCPFDSDYIGNVIYLLFVWSVITQLSCVFGPSKA